jgi:trk system potassium uptake protein TrkH
LIGASPGGTGGGIKTTTFVVTVLAVFATIRGRPTEAFKRRIPEALIRKSLVMLFLVFAFTNVGVMALMLTEESGIAASNHGFQKLVFEVVSAFCTVGMTTGITPELTAPGKLIIITCMYLGRVGPLTLVLAIGRRAAQRFEYPEESVMIG